MRSATRPQFRTTFFPAMPAMLSGAALSAEEHGRLAIPCSAIPDQGRCHWTPFRRTLSYKELAPRSISP